MPIQRDDSEERIARLEKLLEEARAKTGEAASDAAIVEDSPKASAPANASIRRPLARPAESGGKDE